MATSKSPAISARRDTAPPGQYNFRKALIHSSNGYFIYHGLMRGNLQTIVDIGQRCHLGERIGPRHAAGNAGTFPGPKTHQLQLDDQRHGRPVHRPGLHRCHAAADDGHRGGDRQRRQGSLAAAGGSNRTAGSPLPGAGDLFSERPRAR